MARRMILGLALLAMAVGIAAAGDLDSLAGTGGQQGQGQDAAAGGQAAEQVGVSVCLSTGDS